jgi:2-phospho-L-lactate guanylyltransferase
VRALLVPVKSFREAKHRLESVLRPEERAQLAKELAAVVLAAAGDLDVFVACDDGEVADWAVLHGAMVLWTPGLGLSGAVNTGVAHLGEVGYETVVVAHADLPLVTSFDGFGSDGGVTLAPDWRDDGTNVAAVPATAGFRFAYGPASFARHRAEAARLGLALSIVRDERLSNDVDLPSDLHLVSQLLASDTAGLAARKQ